MIFGLTVHWCPGNKKSPPPTGFRHHIRETGGRLGGRAEQGVVNLQLTAAFADEASVGIVTNQTGAEERAGGIQPRGPLCQIEGESAVGRLLLLDPRQRGWLRPMVNAFDQVHDPMAGGKEARGERLAVYCS